MTLSFFVPGLPTAQQRARTGHGHWYDPTKSKAWKEKVGFLAASAYRGPLLTGMVSLVVVCVFPVPKSLKAALRRLVDIGAVVPARTNIDVDNLLKAIMDGIKGVLIKNDHQVWSASVRKQYGPEAGVSVEVCDDYK